MLCNEDIIQINDIDLQEQLEKVKEIEDFSSLVAQYSEISKLLAKKLLEKELNRRSSKKLIGQSVQNVKLE